MPQGHFFAKLALCSGVLAEDQRVVAVEAVGGNDQVGLRRPDLEDAAGEVVLRGVAGAEEMVAVQCRRTALMGTQADRDEDLGARRAQGVPCVRGLQRCAGLGIGERLAASLQGFDLGGSPAQDPYRFALPFDGLELAFGQSCEVDPQRRAMGPGFRGVVLLREEQCATADGTGAGGQHDASALRLRGVARVVVHGIDPLLAILSA